MSFTCVDSVLRDLSKLEKDSRLTSPMEAQIQILKMESRFLKIYLWCLAKWNDAFFGKNKRLGSVRKSHVKATLGKARKGVYTTGNCALDMEKFGDWNIIVTNLLERIQKCKPEIMKSSRDMLNSSFRCSFSSVELHEFMEFIGISSYNLVISLNANTSTIIEKKKQIETLNQTLILFRELFSFAGERCRSQKELNALRVYLQAWVYKAACLSLVYWAARQEGGEENKECRLNTILVDLLQQIRPPCNPEFTVLCLRVLKASKPSPPEFARVRELVFNLVAFLLENLASPLNGSAGILQMGFIFLITYLMYQPVAKLYGEKDESSSTAVLADADAVLDEAPNLIRCLCAGELNEGIAKERNIELQNFIRKIDMVKAEVRRIHVPLLDTSSFCFPRTNAVGFIDLLSKNLEEILQSEPLSRAFAKHEIEIIQEFLSLCPTFKDFFELQKEHEQLKDLWTRIVNVPYQVDLAIKSFLFLENSPWGRKLRLSNVADEMRLIRSKIKDIQDQQINKSGELKEAELNSSPMPPAQTSTPSIDDDPVGFKDEANTIIDLLRSQSKQLEIICIYGMPGQGKTTLANKVYEDPLIQRHFDTRARCGISQHFENRKLLLDILRCLFGEIGDTSRDTREDLEEKLRKYLMGRRYLIVLNDIWDIKAWDALKNSFPKESKGSKILFTTRIRNLTAEAKINCILHDLKPLTDEDCWELLQKKIFGKDKNCPQQNLNVGKNIARKCNGLPMAVVLIAGPLADNVENLARWGEIEERLDSLIASEGYRDLVELSYKHLPDYLRPCFLYFGSFPEDSTIRVQKLIQLWISEGFIRKPARGRLEDVAKEYLMDLVGRSLVMVTSRSSNGGIKKCCTHDLLRDFCLAKGEEENFLHVIHQNDVSRYSMDAKYKHYRLCINNQHWRSFLNSNPPGPFVHSLLFFPTNVIVPSTLERFSSHNYKLLHVLDFEGVEFFGGIPEEITKLVLLRYFAIWCKVTMVPPSVGNLVNLENFRVIGGAIPFPLPHIIWEMKKLRHVDVGGCYIPFSGDSDAEESSYQLENVQTFSMAFLPNGAPGERQLRRIPNVRKLCFCVQTRIFPEENGELPRLDFLSRLESLNIRFVQRITHPFASKLPSSLKKLKLSHSRLPWSAISEFAKLPNLEVLKLLEDAFTGERWDIKVNEFSNLKFLKLYELDFVEWNAPDKGVPLRGLERLVVEQCYNLKEIPSFFCNILPLKSIEVRRCSSEVENSAWDIQEQQAEIGNEDLQVHILKSHQVSEGEIDLSEETPDLTNLFSEGE